MAIAKITPDDKVIVIRRKGTKTKTTYPIDNKHFYKNKNGIFIEKRRYYYNKQKEKNFLRKLISMKREY